MRPEENRPTTPIVVPPRESPLTNGVRSNNSEQAANVVRTQLDSIYESDPHMSTQIPTNGQPVASHNIQFESQPAEVINPYQRTHDESKHQIEKKAWQRYHSAWQDYYQQYYERYYAGEVHRARQELESQVAARSTGVHFEHEPISTDEAMYDIREKLRLSVKQRAESVRKSRHFYPALAAVAVMLIFLFLQYNRLLFATVQAYITPGTLDSSTLIVDPGAQGAVGPDPRLIIPNINVDVPIIWDANAADQNSLNAAMDKGVAWFNIPGANARPGQKGNFVVSGHSSNDWLEQGDYKFIFARLEQMKVGDVIYANYNGKRYTYNVTKITVVKPTDVQALTEPVSKPTITLVTCTPLGTALNRLLVFADQVSPDPNGAEAPTASAASSEPAKMPSNAPTFFERLFGIN
jgi:sortase A